jgi:hypothetical protein
MALSARTGSDQVPSLDWYAKPASFTATQSPGSQHEIAESVPDGSATFGQIIREGSRIALVVPPVTMHQVGLVHETGPLKRPSSSTGAAAGVDDQASPSQTMPFAAHRTLLRQSRAPAVPPIRDGAVKPWVHPTPFQSQYVPLESAMQKVDDEHETSYPPTPDAPRGADQFDPLKM